MADTRSNRQMIGTLIFLVWGPTSWALQLLLVYGSQSSLCAIEPRTHLGGPEETASMAVVGLTLICAALAAVGFLAPHRVYRFLTGALPPEELWPFLKGVMRGLTALSVLAMLYAGLAGILLDACAQLR